MVYTTDDYLRWACARTSATANGDLARPQDLAQPKPAHPIVADAVHPRHGASALPIFPVVCEDVGLDLDLDLTTDV